MEEDEEERERRTEQCATLMGTKLVLHDVQVHIHVGGNETERGIGR